MKIYHIYIDEHYGPCENQYAFTKRKARRIFNEKRDSLIKSAKEMIEMMKEEFEEEKQKKKLTTQDIKYHTEGITDYQKKVNTLSQMTFDNCHEKDWYSEIFGDSVNWKKVKVRI